MKSARHMKTAARWISASTIAAALILTFYCGSGVRSRPQIIPLVDNRPFENAKAMSHLASTQEEREFSAQILNSADEELDVVFSMALREARTQPVSETPEAKQFAARVSKGEAQVRTDQDQIGFFQAQIAKVNSSQREALQPQLDLLQAQLELDQDELETAREDLTRAGADPASRIQRMWDAHKTAQHASVATTADAVTNGAEAGFDGNSLISQIPAWYSLSRKTTPLMQARQELLAGAAALEAQHRNLEIRLNDLTTQTRKSQKSNNTGPAQDSPVAQLVAMTRLTATQRNINDVENRVDKRQEMSNAYGEWMSFLRGRERIAMIGVLRSGLWIVLIILVAPPVAHCVERRIATRAREDQRLVNLSAIAGFGMQALGLVLCLLVIFGFPQELPTAIFGLLGAGVTVALKDVAGVIVDNHIRELLNAKSKSAAAT